MPNSALVTIDMFLQRYGDQVPGGAKVLDVGAGRSRPAREDLFVSYGLRYLSVSFESLETEKDSSCDIVLSVDMLSRCDDPASCVERMSRALNAGGYLCLIAPSSKPGHGSPPDVRRFGPDAYRSFAGQSGLTLLDLYVDDKGPRNDLVGIFRKGPPCEIAGPEGSAESHYLRNIRSTLQIEPRSAAADRWPGAPRPKTAASRPTYLDVLKALHAAVRPRLYVEIGVRRGKSLALAEDARCIGIDPCPDLKRPVRPNETIVAETSDLYFHRCDRAQQQDLTLDFDIAFIDGMHLFEFVLRDFMNLEKRSRSESIIVVDDIFPGSVEEAARSRSTLYWTGDVWKFIEILRQYRPDLDIRMLDAEPTGLAVISGLNRNDRVLLAAYDDIVDRFSGMTDAALLEKYLSRQDSEPWRDTSVGAR